MLTVGIIAAVLVIIGFLRVSVTAEYSSEGITAFCTFGVLRVFSFPKEKKYKPKKEQKKRKPRAKKAKKEGKKGGEKQKPTLKEQFGGSFKMIMKMLPGIFQVLNKFRKKLVIHELTLHYTVACDDPYDTAMRYGEFTAGLGVLSNMFQSFFKVKKCDMQTSFDFTVTEPVIYVKAKLSLSIGRILGIALTAGKALLKVIVQNNYGKAVK